MDIAAKITEAKEIGAWVQGKTFNISVPSDDRARMGVALLQHVLDLADGVTVLIEANLPGPAFSFLRPLHEGYTRGVWLLNHASEQDLQKVRG